MGLGSLLCYGCSHGAFFFVAVLLTHLDTRGSSYSITNPKNDILHIESSEDQIQYG